MCGIFGISIGSGTSITPKELKAVADKLFLLSESRGKEASGIFLVHNNKARLIREPCPASQLIRSDSYNDLFKNLHLKQSGLCLIGHSRLVTHGHESVDANNQPVVKGQLIGVHNGIIVNEQEIWSALSGQSQLTELDSEALFALIQDQLLEKSSLKDSIETSIALTRGTASIACLSLAKQQLALCTNNGSLYASSNEGITLFSSEKYILQSLFASTSVKYIKGLKIDKIPNNDVMVVDISQAFGEQVVSFDYSEPQELVTAAEAPSISTECEEKYPYLARKNMKRCSRCVLPATMPFITFDSKGVCNFCHTYTPDTQPDMSGMHEIADKIRSGNDEPDCLVAVSGGRDSCFGLHVIVKELGLTPVTFTYDWGMVTDIARRNQARLCGALGIEHIVVSADIKKKRENIHKNVNAWLKKPCLCTVPLLMAGDKQFYYYANQLASRLNIDTIIFCENGRYEKTRFKSGFCGIDEGHRRLFNLNLSEKLKLAAKYMAEFIKNPAYINSSMIDSFQAYISAYHLNHDYVQLFDYRSWDEKEVERVLIKDYDWELLPDASTTWRIGDGTAPFYNYIYHKLAGFSEFDTFRSNQIRDGVLSRKEALTLVEEENRPRWDSIKWYTDVVGVDFNRAIQIINKAPKLY